MSTASKKASTQKAASRARKAEAKPDEDVALRFEIAGNAYVVDRAAVTDVEFFEACEDGKEITAIRTVLGVEQWQRLKDSIRDADGRVPAERLEPFLDAMLDAAGLGN